MAFSTGKSNEKDSPEIRFRKVLVLYLLLAPAIIYGLYIFGPRFMFNDWVAAFYPVSKIPLTPFDNQYFLNAPWLALILSPLGLFSLDLARAINTFLALFFVSLVVIRYGGSLWSILWVVTSSSFISLIGNGSVDWAVAAGVVFPSIWTTLFVLTKPQTGFFLVILWFKRSEQKLRFALIASAFAVLSFIIWGLWPLDMYQNIVGQNVLNRPLASTNLSLFPWSVPVGLALFYYAWKNDDDLAAVWGSLCVSPYFVEHSLVVGFAMFVGRYPRFAPYLWTLLWILPVLPVLLETF